MQLGRFAVRVGMLVLLAQLAGVGVASADPTVTRPFEATHDCVNGLDGAGAVVAAGGDYNGDGIADFAYAAPCAQIKSRVGVGRVWVRSGKNGKVLRRARGSQEKMYFGAALAFVGDLDGDGRDELAVGAPGFDAALSAGAPNSGDVGQVRVYRFAQGGPLAKLIGGVAGAEFGASLAGLSDEDGDDVPDFVVGAPAEPTPGGVKSGAIHVISGADGAVLDTAYGEKAGQRFGTTVGNAGFIDADAFDDILVTSEKNPVGGVLNAGGIEVRSGADPAARLFPAFGGAANDRLGASSASDHAGRFFAGAPGTRSDDGIKQAGAVHVFDVAGVVQLTATDDEPQLTAQFGTAVAPLEDVTGDDVPDFVASAPFFDSVTGAGPLAVNVNVGKISVVSGADGTIVRSVTGAFREGRLGRALASGIDLNGDGTQDIVAGNPGDAPKGRRYAGSVNVYSGLNFNLIRSFAGIHGFESRVFTFSGGIVRNFDRTARQRGKDVAVDLGSSGALSLDVLDKTLSPPQTGRTRVVAGTGHSAKSSRVAVVSGAQIVDQFDAFPGSQVGSSVAAGDLDNDKSDEIVVAQASSKTGAVPVNVFSVLPADPSRWSLAYSFDAFVADEQFAGKTIGANGANVLVTGLRPEDGREIVAAPYLGAPLVRVFDQNGVLLLEWLAYDDDGKVDGVQIAAADLDGDGTNEIVTAPTSGVALVRAFTDDGIPFVMPGATSPVAFLALPEDVRSGVRLTAADLDLDGRQEIVVVARSGDGDILVFEPDGSQTPDVTPIVRPGGTLAIAGTDRFVRP